MTSVFAWQTLPKLFIKQIASPSEPGAVHRVLEANALTVPAADATTLGDLSGASTHEGEVVLPMALIDTPHGPVLHRLPLQLARWAMLAGVEVARSGEIFPTMVEFSDHNGRFSAEFLDEAARPARVGHCAVEHHQDKDFKTEVRMAVNTVTVTTYCYLLKDSVTVEAQETSESYWRMREIKLKHPMLSLPAGEAIRRLCEAVGRRAEREQLECACWIQAKPQDRFIRQNMAALGFVENDDGVLEYEC